MSQDSEFIMDMLFVSVFADDHEDAMMDILYCLVDMDEEEPEYIDIMIAADFAGAYHRPTSMEQDALNDIRRILSLEYLNG